MASPEAGQIPLGSRLGRIVLAVTILGTSVAMLMGTVVNVALPSIGEDLGAGTAGQQWVVNGYLLTLAGLILVGGSLGDRFGRVRVYRIGVAWFAIASLACALAPSTGWLIGARLLQGVGGALLTPGSLSILEATIAESDRGRAIGWWAGLTGIAAATGPLIGGLLIAASWRWAFLINVPVAVVVFALAPRVPETSDPAAEGTDLDVGGGALAVLALGGATYAIIRSSADRFGWTGWGAIGLAVVAAGWLAQHERRAEHPMVPLRLFANRRFAAANAITLLVYGGLGIVFFLVSIHLQVVVGWSALAAGAALLPVTALMLALSSTFGDLAQRHGPRGFLTGGPLLIAVGMVLIGGIGADADYVTDVLPGVAVFGLGLAVSVAPVTSTALGSVPEERSGAASGANNAVARTGQLLTVAAIPPLVGLGGDALNRAEELAPRFPSAMAAGAGLVALGALVAVALLRDEEEDQPIVTSPRSCPLDGPPVGLRRAPLQPPGRQPAPPTPTRPSVSPDPPRVVDDVDRGSP